VQQSDATFSCAVVFLAIGREDIAFDLARQANRQ